MQNKISFLIKFAFNLNLLRRFNHALVLPIMMLFQIYSFSVNAMDPSIDDFDQLFSRAEEIKKNEIAPLDLEGKTVINAMRKLMLQGYSCGRILPIRGFDFDPTYECDKDISELHCSKASVHFLLRKQIERGTSRYWEALENANIDTVSVMCLFPNFLPNNYLVHQTEAETKLTNLVDGFQLKPLSGQGAREKLIKEYFSCGFDFSKSDAPSLICSKVEPDIPYCHDAIVQVDLGWNKPLRNKIDVFDNLESSTVQTVKSMCKLRYLQPRN